MASNEIRKPGMIPGFFLLIACFLVASVATRTKASKDNFDNVCRFVSERIYLSSLELKDFQVRCLERASSLHSNMPLEEILSVYNDLFSTLDASHLSMYSLAESQKLWEGTSEETGIEAHFVQGELAVAKVHSLSPAAKAGVQFGDIILKINGQLSYPKQAVSAAGKYLLEQRGFRKTVEIKPAVFERDEAPEIHPLTSTVVSRGLANVKNTAVLSVPSFRAEYFEDALWKKQIEELKTYQHIIVDLRGNLGGNFVAGLRFLSPFLCKPTEIGSLIKPKSKLKSRKALTDELTDDRQLDIVDSSNEVVLTTFEGYGCLQSSVQVLVDSSSASTSEMVAQALKDFKGAMISGAPSAGQLLVGVWYYMPEIGPGVRLSIPEAIYKTHRGVELEGPGVKVDATLYYHLDELQKGEDSWIKAVSSRGVPK